MSLPTDRVCRAKRDNPPCSFVILLGRSDNTLPMYLVGIQVSILSRCRKPHLPGIAYAKHDVYLRH